MGYREETPTGERDQRICIAMVCGALIAFAKAEMSGGGHNRISS